MPGRQRSTPKLAISALFALLLAGAAACGSHETEGPAPPALAATSIPMGAPGAQGVAFTPTPPPTSTPIPAIEQKINPGAGPSVLPPDPFGLPPDPDDGDPPRVPVVKPNPKGGTVL